MRIRRRFIQLTKYTYPHGTEVFLKSHLPVGHRTDKWMNYYYVIGENPTTMFTCHLDTACSKREPVVHIQIDGVIKTDGKTILGADDKAGVVVILNMIEKKIPGLYYFFLGEEVGCVGSGYLSKNWSEFEFSKTIKKVVSFDRKDTCSVITHQLYGRCCSDEFAKELSSRLNGSVDNMNLSPDITGVSTDSAKFVRLVPECTNISVGYYKEHTTSESQDIKYLQRLCRAVCRINWEDLPVIRDHTVDENYGYGYYDEMDADYDMYANVIGDDLYPCKQKQNLITEYEWSSKHFSYFIVNGETTKMYVSYIQVRMEKKFLFNWMLNSKDYIGVESVQWNGDELYVKGSDGHSDYVGDRPNLMKVIPKIGKVKTSMLRKNLPTGNEPNLLIKHVDDFPSIIRLPW